VIRAWIKSELKAIKLVWAMTVTAWMAGRERNVICVLLLSSVRVMANSSANDVNVTKTGREMNVIVTLSARMMLFARITNVIVG